VPLFNVERSELLQDHAADERHDLVLGELPVTLRRPGRDIAGRFPLVDASTHEVAHNGPARRDIGALSHRSEQLGELGLRRALAAVVSHILDLTRARGGIAVNLELEFP
jgi:hypothetical protein